MYGFKRDRALYLCTKGVIGILHKTCPIKRGLGRSCCLTVCRCRCGCGGEARGQATDCAAAARRRSRGAAPKRKRAQSVLIKELIKNGLFGEWRHGGAGRPRRRRDLPPRSLARTHVHRTLSHFLLHYTTHTYTLAYVRCAEPLFDLLPPPTSTSQHGTISTYL